MNKNPDLSFVDKIQEFSAIPAVVMEIWELLNEQPEKYIELTIIDRINLDPALAAFVLKFCNSPFFSPRENINTISHAYNMLGFNRIKAILISYFLRNLSDKISNKHFGNYLWEHSFQVAFISRILARHLGISDESELAYTAGLLHDIGKLAIYFYDRENYEYLLQHTDKERKSLYPIEYSTYGFTHADTGSRLLKKWRFSDLLIHTAQCHHDFQNCTSKEKIVGVVAFANATAHHALEKQEIPSQFLEFFNMSENKYNQVIDEIFDALSNSWALTLK